MYRASIVISSRSRISCCPLVDNPQATITPSTQAMSEEQLKALLEAVKADAGLQEQLKAAGDADALVAIAKAAGFAISAEEWRVSEYELEEISEDELEGVAGGRDCMAWRGNDRTVC